MIGLDSIRQLKQFPLGGLGCRERSIILEFHFLLLPCRIWRAPLRPASAYRSNRRVAIAGRNSSQAIRLFFSKCGSAKVLGSCRPTFQELFVVAFKDSFTTRSAPVREPSAGTYGATIGVLGDLILVIRKAGLLDDRLTGLHQCSSRCRM